MSQHFSFVPKKFERIFQKFSHSEEDALSWLEIEAMLVANRDFLRPLSWYVRNLLITEPYVYICAHAAI
jgi:hypothetical protein